VVEASRTPQEVTIIVTDDGPGFRDDADVDSGLGLQIVRTLVEEDLGGSLALGPAGGPGSRVTLRVPVS
jgi:two-component sensor histidine kinase